MGSPESGLTFDYLSSSASERPEMAGDAAKTKSDELASQRTAHVRSLEFPTFNAIAKKYNAKAKKGETSGTGISIGMHEHDPWNKRGAGPRHTPQ